jgi:hypothetical protein
VSDTFQKKIWLQWYISNMITFNEDKINYRKKEKKIERERRKPFCCWFYSLFV